MPAPDADPYSTRVAALFFAARHAGVLTDANAAGAAGRIESGVRVAFTARVRDGRVEALRYQAYGCPHVVATCDLLAERLEGGPASDAAGADPLALAAELGVPAGKRGRLLTVQDALRNCFRDWDTTQPAR